MIKQETKKNNNNKKTNKKHLVGNWTDMPAYINSCTCFHEIKINLIKETLEITICCTNIIY